MSLILHQFPISHYCEKVRWALDHKGLAYQAKNYLPGLHLKKIRRMARRSSVPVLEHDGHFVQGSAEILSYLDEQFPEHPLTPGDPALRERALEIERFFDREVGPHVRRFCYDTLLEHPRVVVPLLAQGGPFWARPLLYLVFPKLKSLMRRTMTIREPEVSESRQALEEALQRLPEMLDGGDYLAGEHFSRADMAAASMLAPLFMPPGYGLQWPQRVPEPLASWIAEHRQGLAWAERIRARHR